MEPEQFKHLNHKDDNILQQNIMVNLSLCLNKYRIMKTYWGSGGIAPCFLNLGIRWRQVGQLHAPATLFPAAIG